MGKCHVGAGEPTPKAKKLENMKCRLACVSCVPGLRVSIWGEAEGLGF